MATLRTKFLLACILFLAPLFAHAQIGPAPSPGTLPQASGAGQAPISTGAGKVYTAQPVPSLSTNSVQTFHGAIVSPSVNNFANLASQSGSVGTGQFNTWIANVIGLGNRSYLWADPLASSGAPTSALTSLTRVIDTRGTNCMDQTGNFTFADNSLCFEAAEDSQDSTTATVDKANVHIGYNSRKGGVYSFNGSTGVKSNRSALALNGDWQTVSQKWGIYGLLNSYTGGETIAYSAFMQEYGGYLGNGEEPTEGVRIEQQQATVTDSLGGIWKATVSGVSGSVVSFSTPTNSYTLGEARIIRDLSTSYSTGSIASVSCSGSSPDTCTVTGSGTSWTSISGFVGTHTTWNGLATAGPVLTSNLALCFAPNANDGYDWCVPITSGVNDTTLTVNLYDIQVGSNGAWYGPTTGSYVIYHSSWPTSVDTYADTFSAGDVSGIGNGDIVDQVQAYNGNFYGMLIEQQRHIGRPNFGGGLLIQDFSDSGAPGFNFGIDVNGNYLYGLQLGGNFGTPQYGVFSGGGGATRIPIWMADLTTASTTPIHFFEYYRSDGVAQIPIVFDTNTADTTEGFELFPNLAVIPLHVSSSGVVNIPVITGSVSVGSVYNNNAGVLGTYQNLLKYSQFDSASIGSTWATYQAAATSITPNTTDVTDPNGGNTAEAFVAPASFGSFTLAGQQQSVTLTSGLPYSAKLCFRGAAGGEFVEYGLSTSPYDAALTLTTSWQCVSISKTTSGSVTPGIFWATPTASATIYVAFAQLEQAASSGYYVRTVGSAQVATNGVVASNIQIPNTASGSPLCTDGNSNISTCGATTPSIVAQSTFVGASLTISPVTIYTPSAQGVYEICSGWVVTAAGVTTTTLSATALWYNAGVQQHVVNGLGGVIAATAIGANNATTATSSTCQTILSDASEPIEVGYTVGGTGTNLVYTYWYTLIKK